MKKLPLIVALFLLFGCNEESVPVEKPQETKQVKIELEEKKEQPQVERVCIMVYDGKLKKEVEKCRTMKIHEKFEGTKVPTK